LSSLGGPVLALSINATGKLRRFNVESKKSQWANRKIVGLSCPEEGWEWAIET
jgi:hypothetical protein